MLVAVSPKTPYSKQKVEAALLRCVSEYFRHKKTVNCISVTVGITRSNFHFFIDFCFKTCGGINVKNLRQMVPSAKEIIEIHQL